MNSNTPDTSEIKTSDLDQILTTDKLPSSQESTCWERNFFITKSNSKIDENLGTSMQLEDSPVLLTTLTS